MKKSIFLFVFTLFVANAAYSQFKLGIKLSPTISLNQVQDLDNDDGYSIENNGFGLRYSVGPIADIFFGENYAFSTGLLFTQKRSGFTIKDKSAGTGLNYETVHNGQYLQIPATLKLFTNEIASDMRLYFQLGGTFDFLLGETLLKWDANIPEPEADKVDFHTFFDMGVLLGAGVEMQMGSSTAVFGGLSYNRGLFNVLSNNANNNLDSPNNTSPRTSDFNNTTHAIFIDLGLKF